jgi:hypothetical protein
MELSLEQEDKRLVLVLVDKHLVLVLEDKHHVEDTYDVDVVEDKPQKEDMDHGRLWGMGGS